jgi:hypothetical protein
MWKRKPKAEWVPWYRERKYTGDFTEAEKRQLDAFRTQAKHPAATYADLPDEAQKYLSNIELELYDKKQDGVAGQAFLYSAIAGGILFLNYKSCFNAPDAPDVWLNLGAVLLVVFAWVRYWWRWRKNAEEFLPAGAPWRSTQEGIRKQWELNYIFYSRKRLATSDE